MNNKTSRFFKRGVIIGTKKGQIFALLCALTAGVLVALTFKGFSLSQFDGSSTNAGSRRRSHLGANLPPSIINVLDEPDEILDIRPGCEWTKESVIPPTIHLIWNIKTLDPQPAELDRTWQQKEPCFERGIVTTAQCEEFASRFSDLRPVYDNLPTGMMKSDVCRILAVYFLGGVYMDQNIAWETPLKSWWNPTTEFLAARIGEETPTFANWFFGAPKGSKCLHHALEMIMEKADRSWEDPKVNKAQANLINELFTDALEDCEVVPQLTEADVTTDKIRQKNEISALLVDTDGDDFEVAPGCEWTKNSVIPPKINMVWKTKTLFEESLEVDRLWKEKEPCFKRRIITDGECAALASRFPGLRASYDRVPMNVMRADICRVLVVYYLGGAYMDLDVAWKQPLKSWWITDTELLTGREKDDGSWYCNWFFAAKKGNKCMHRVLSLITERINRTWDQSLWEAKSHLVHKTTGPEVFADALKDCGAVPQLGEADVTWDKIHHLYGSHHWRKSKGYTSWTEERAKLGGWKKMLAFRVREPGAESYLTRNPEELVISHKPLADYSSSSILMLRSVTQRTYRLPGAEVGGPMLAVDNYLESYAELPDEGDPNWWEMAFADPLYMNNPNNPVNDSLYCVRILGRRDDHESIVNRMDGIGLMLLQDPKKGSKNPTEVYRKTNIKVTDGQILRVRPTASGNPSRPVKIDRLRVFRNGYLAISEVQVFTDRECTEYRTLVTPDQKKRDSLLMPPMPSFKSDFDGLTRKLFYLLGARTYYCRHMRWLGEFMDDDALWPICTAGHGATKRTPYAKHLPLYDPNDPKAVPTAEDAHKKATVISFGWTPDQIMEKDLAELQYDVHTFDEWYRIKKIEGVDITPGIGNVTRHGIDLQVDSNSVTNSTLMHLSDIVRHIGVDHVSVLRLDCKGREWGAVDSIIDLAKQQRIDHLMLQLHLDGPDGVWNDERARQYVEAMEKLHEYFYVVAVRQDNRGNVLHQPFVLYKWMKVVMVRKTLVEAVNNYVPPPPEPVSCEWLKDSVIPPVLNSVWKTKTLFKESLKVDTIWRKNEPCFEKKIVTDDECAELASQFPGLRPLYDKLPMNVMRADICRVLVVYFNGGAYMDLDVEWVKPFDEWWNMTTDLLLGYENDDGSFFCNWFFAAKKGNKCMHRVLELITERINRKWDKSVWEGPKAVVHYSTGPEVFADALKDCGAQPQLKRIDITEAKIRHLFGSLTWKSAKGYSSWTAERAKLGGWKSMQGLRNKPVAIQHYVMRDPEELVRPWVDIPQEPKENLLVINDIKLPRIRWAPFAFESVENAIDNNIESHVTSDPFLLTMTLQKPMEMESPDGSSSLEKNTDTLHCIRLLAIKDDHESATRRMLGWVVVLKMGSRVVYEVKNPPVLDGQIVMLRTQAEEPGVKFDVIELSKPVVGPVDLAELQVFTEPQCKTYRRIVTQKQYERNTIIIPRKKYNADTYIGSTLKFYTILYTRDYYCPHVRVFGEEMDLGHIWRMCVFGDAPYLKRIPLWYGSAADPSNKTTNTIVLSFGKSTDSVIEKDFAELGYQVHSFDPHYKAKKEEGIDETPFGKIYKHGLALQYSQRDDETFDHTTLTITEAVEQYGGDYVSIIKIFGLRTTQWDAILPMCEMARKKKLDHLLLEFKHDSPWEKAFFGKQKELECLEELFHTTSNGMNRAGDVGRIRFDFPGEEGLETEWPRRTVVTFLRKSLVEDIDSEHVVNSDIKEK